MSVVIIGKGFVGSAIIKALEIKKIPCYGYSSKEFNLCNPGTWKFFPDNIEQVILAAGEISNISSRLVEINVKPIRHLCDFLKIRKVKKIIMLSSGAVYGNYAADLYPGLLCSPSTNYGNSKLNAENLMIKYWGGSLYILRLFFPYGPMQSSSRLVPNLIQKIKNSAPILLNRNEGPIVSLTHVNDLAAVVVNDFVCRTNQQILYNIASPCKMSIYNLAKKLSKYIGKLPIFEIAQKESSNCTSIPYDFPWKYSGEFQDLFYNDYL